MSAVLGRRMSRYIQAIGSDVRRNTRNNRGQKRKARKE
jgi:hypothetical protein